MLTSIMSSAAGMKPVTPINIRNLGPEDAYILDRVRPGLASDTLDPSQVWAFLATRVNELVVALDQGEVVGFASGTTVMHPDHPTEFMIANLVVHPDFKRQGIGRRLLQRITALAEDRGCVHIWARAREDNVAFRSLASSLDAQTVKGDLIFHW